MKSALRLIACLALSLALGMTGCEADDSGRAYDAMAEMSAATDRAAVLDQQAAEVLGGLGVLEPSPEDAEAALKLLGEAKKLLDEKDAELMDAEDALERVADLEIDGDLRLYAVQQQEIVSLQLEGDKAAYDLLEALEELYQAGGEGTLTDARSDELSARIDEIIAAGDAVDQQVATKVEASEKFYNDKGLGE